MLSWNRDIRLYAATQHTGRAKHGVEGGGESLFLAPPPPLLLLPFSAESRGR